MSYSRLTFFTLCAGAFVLLSVASAAAKPGVATTTVNLRADANTTSDIVAKIPGGSRIDIGDCKEGWCAVTFQGKSGFAIATALDTTGRAPRRQARRAPQGYVYDDEDDYEPVAPYPPGYVVGPPVYVGPGPFWGPRPYYGYRRWGYGWRRW